MNLTDTIIKGAEKMEINLSAETIKTVYNSLRSNRHSLKYSLEHTIPNGKMHINRKEIIEYQLAEVEEALQIFEELMEIIN
jgi:hypothetical protein